MLRNMELDDLPPKSNGRFCAVRIDRQPVNCVELTYLVIAGVLCTRSSPGIIGPTGAQISRLSDED